MIAKLRAHETIFNVFIFKAARLGNISFLSGPASQQQPELKLEVTIINCSKLWISSDFQKSWRTLYTSLHLTIDAVSDVIQEETANDMVDASNILKSELISK